MVTRFIRTMIETVRPPRLKIDIAQDLRRSTFDLGGDIEMSIAITPKQGTVHVVEGSVALIRDLEIVRLIQTMIPDRKAAMGAHHRGGPVMIPKMMREKSVDVHHHTAVVFARDEALGPGDVAFPVRLEVPEALPRPPSNVTSARISYISPITWWTGRHRRDNLLATWKLVATLELDDGTMFRAERAVTVRG